MDGKGRNASGWSVPKIMLPKRVIRWTIALKTGLVELRPVSD